MGSLCKKKESIITYIGRTMNEIFDYLGKLNKEDNAPLAHRMCPKNIEDFVGQEHIVGRGKLLRRMIDADKVSSIILYGPPGTGKTSLATIIANSTKANFVKINATKTGKKGMEDAVENARSLFNMYSQKTILFIDEIHRFNKAQQDFLLPYVEDGTITLIGATTENPYFEVNNALISRSIVFELKKLDKNSIIKLINRTLKNFDNVFITDDAKELMANLAAGDARRMYNALELAVMTTEEVESKIFIDTSVVKECMQKPFINYDKGGDNHYDNISAFIKSMRGSDPDATLYYLAKMIYSGEEIKFIARRIIICAAEDVGLADPMALVVATNASLAVERVGMPEARIILSEAALYVATAPKSNSAYLGIDKAINIVKETNYEVPKYLKDGHYSGANKLGNAIGYIYPHDYDEHYVKQRYMPSELVNEIIYINDEQGYQKVVKEYMSKVRGENEES